MTSKVRVDHFKTTSRLICDEFGSISRLLQNYLMSTSRLIEDYFKSVFSLVKDLIKTKHVISLSRKSPVQWLGRRGMTIHRAPEYQSNIGGTM